MSVCRCSQTACRKYCSIISGYVSNCSYRLPVHHATSSRLSWAYSFFIRQKHPKPRGNRVASASVYFNGQRPALSPAERAVTVGRQRIAITCTVSTAVCVCVCTCVRSCVFVCVPTRVHACMRACVRDVFAIYDNNIWPTLIMTII